MANFSIRRLDDRIYQKLRIRAANHGVSMEEEARRIITKAVSSPQKISSIFLKHFGEKNGVDIEIPDQRKAHEPMEFDE